MFTPISIYVSANLGRSLWRQAVMIMTEGEEQTRGMTRVGTKEEREKWEKGGEVK